jgi:sulfite exporter TauE/SafE
MLGLIIGILPCAPLITVVSYIGLIAKHWFNTVIYSLSFGLGTVFSPLLVLLIFTGLIPKFIKKERIYRIFNLACGLIIVFLGVQLIRRVF